MLLLNVAVGVQHQHQHEESHFEQCCLSFPGSFPFAIAIHSAVWLSQSQLNACNGTTNPTLADINATPCTDELESS